VTSEVFHVDRDLVMDWAEIAGDFNPLHVDAAYAAMTRFGGPIVHGSLLLALVADRVQDLHGARLVDGGELTFEFRAPVLIGSTLTIHPQGDGFGIKVGETTPIETSVVLRS
jgi:acyl dehydratase